MTTPTATTLAPTPARVWRAARLPVALGLLIVLTGLLVVALTDQGVRGSLDPAAVDEGGSRAVAELLGDQGVAVQVVRTRDEVRAAGPGTVLVPFPGDLAEAQLAAVRDTGADVVLVEPGYAATEVDARITVTALADDGQPRGPGCGLRAAVAAGELEPAGQQFTAPGAVACYPGALGASVLQVRDGERTVTVLGDSAPLTNDAIDEGGNAALALGLLGAQPRLLWYLPSAADQVGDEPQRDLAELVPAWVGWGVLQLVVAAVLLVLWRARRLGPVVREPLPVVVRAAEAVEGRARLYRRAGAREHAAETLREASRARLRPLVGLPGTAAPAELVDAVTARVQRPGVGALLYGPPPGDDAGLVVLARMLDDCEGEVRRS